MSINITKHCSLCDTPVEFESEGQRRVFTTHDAAFCSSTMWQRIQILERALRSVEEDRADSEGKLRLRLHRQDIEIDLLRELAEEVIGAIHDDVLRVSLRRTLRDRWAERIAERMEERRKSAELRHLLAKASLVSSPVP